jgi:hypothetical protein
MTQQSRPYSSTDEQQARDIQAAAERATLIPGSRGRPAVRGLG